jgi:hypothetical protein
MVLTLCPLDAGDQPVQIAENAVRVVGQGR